jgi:hypothetical protein
MLDKIIGNHMTRNEAKLELFKVERQIEKKIVEHANELGQYNKNCVYNELQQLWDRKDILKKFVNS